MKTVLTLIALTSLVALAETKELKTHLGLNGETILVRRLDASTPADSDTLQILDCSRKCCGAASSNPNYRR